MSVEADSRMQARSLARAALERGARELVALDVRAFFPLAEVFIICSGTSDRNVRAVADAVLECAAQEGLEKRGTEGYDEAHWILIDLGDIIFHIFLNEWRAHYDLERLWEDGARLFDEEILRDMESDA